MPRVGTVQATWSNFPAPTLLGDSSPARAGHGKPTPTGRLTPEPQAALVFQSAERYLHKGARQHPDYLSPWFSCTALVCWITKATTYQHGEPKFVFLAPGQSMLPPVTDGEVQALLPRHCC